MEVDAEGRDGRIVFTLLYVPERHLVHSDENASPKISGTGMRRGKKEGGGTRCRKIATGREEGGR